LLKGDTPNNYYTIFGLTTRRQVDGITKAVYKHCIVKGDRARQFVEQHSKGSIVILFGQTAHTYDPSNQKTHTPNKMEVLDWFYPADIEGHFDELTDDELRYLNFSLRYYRKADQNKRQQLWKKIKELEGD